MVFAPPVPKILVTAFPTAGNGAAACLTTGSGAGLGAGLATATGAGLTNVTGAGAGLTTATVLTGLARIAMKFASAVRVS